MKVESHQVFSFHLRRVSLVATPFVLFRPPRADGLHHAESFVPMQLGASVLSPKRYGFMELATLCWWRDAAAFDAHLASPYGRALSGGWYVLATLYRRWGSVREIADAVVYADAAPRSSPIVAITLARLRLTETLRFTRYGKPVERQVRDHPGKTLALAAVRPLATFCTFSIWHNEEAMVGMVQGRDDAPDGPSHKLAMRERVRRDFHHAFTTMRLVPVREVGKWRGVSEFTKPQGQEPMLR